MGLFNKLRKGMKKQVAQMPRGIARDMGPGNIPRRSGGFLRGLPMAKPRIIEGRAERLPVGPLTTRMRIEDMLRDRLTNLPVGEPVEAPVMPRISMPELTNFQSPVVPTPAPSGIAALMDRLKNISIFGQKMPQPMPGAMPQVDMQNIPQIPTRESIQDYVRENIDLSNLQSRMPNIQMFQEGGEAMPFVSGATRIEAGLDPLSRQLLFGLDGRGGFIPGAFRAAERTFFTPEGEARVIPEEIAGLTPDQLRAMEIARQTGVQDPYLQQARQAYERGLGALGRGFGRAEAEQTRAVQDILGGVSQAEALRGRGLAGLTGALGEAGQIARGATGIFGAGLRDPEALLRGTLGGYDPRMTEQFYDPFEERVVQQTIRDVLERGEQADIAARAADIGRGGESAFGSRARLMAGERERALGRGLGEAISGIRSAGFQRAQQAGMGEFGRQLEARRQAASGLAGLAGQRLGAQQTLGQTLAGLGSTQQQALSQAGQQALGAQQALAGARSGLAGLQQQMAAQQQAAQFGAGQALAGLGTQAQMAQQADISQLLGVGAQQQQQQQAVLDAQRRAALQAQQAPLAQYQSLLPFVQAVPAGQQQVTTTFAPPPSPLQAGLGVGLSTLGALGQFMNQPQQQQFNPATRTI